ncbi:MAG: DNA topoisomerase IV [Flavobacteriaceae bacterium]|nr:DNA topoisomerase IV [Flavobacteriaceae bacterium]
MFKTLLDDHTTVSFATRNKTTQVETFNGKKDTFLIHWKSDFEYTLKKTNPKNDLDSTEFIVKITGIYKNSYTFKAYFKGSNFKQKGKVIKIKTEE